MMKLIEKTAQINAPKDKVWNVLLEDEYQRIWMAEFMDGSHAETDWIEGHKVRFLDNDGNGIVGRIVTKRPYEALEMEYDGEVKNGEDDLDSEMAKQMKGATENYYLSEDNGVTTLKVEVNMDAKWYDMMMPLWDKALVKIDELSISI